MEVGLDGGVDSADLPTTARWEQRRGRRRNLGRQDVCRCARGIEAQTEVIFCEVWVLKPQQAQNGGVGVHCDEKEAEWKTLRQRPCAVDCRIEEWKQISETFPLGEYHGADAKSG